MALKTPVAGSMSVMNTLHQQRWSYITEDKSAGKSARGENTNDNFIR